MGELITFVGLDAHKDTIAVALADEGKRREVASTGSFLTRPARCTIPGLPQSLRVCRKHAISAGVKCSKESTLSVCAVVNNPRGFIHNAAATIGGTGCA